MNNKDTSANLPMFFDMTRKYDKVRNEKLVEVFPELKEFFEKYET